jgi:tetratricopeptide (TPR) repeat protein
MQAQLPSLDASQLSAEQAQTLDDMKVNLALHEVEILRNKNELDWALQLLAQWRQSHPDNVQILYAQAQTLRTAGKREQAAENYQLLLAQKPDDHRAAIALIEIQVDLHENDDARHGITAQLLDLNGVTEDQMADLISAQIDLQDYADAKQLTATALGINPNSPRALADASQLARRDGDLPKAIDYLQHSLASDAAQRSATGPAQLSALRVVQNPDQPTTPEAELEATPTSASELTAAQSDHYSYRRLAEMLDQHTDWFFSAFDRHSRSGTQGISEYDATEIPLAWERAQGPGGRWTFHVDLEQINAGILNLADSGNAASFGSVLLCQPQCNSGTFNQSASGVAFNASLQRDNVRYDIGTSPLGFPVKTIVGGILVKGDLGPLGYSFDMSRRPVTGNLLSYAGVADPRTGQTWGGVDATGVRLGLSLDSGGRYGWWSSLGLHDLNGENVKGNLRLQLMTGGTLRLINEDDLLLQLGLTGMVWRFRQNVGQYTFGDGGYYSPQRYESLSLPVTFGARYARLSFSMRASISSSYSETNAAPYFPTDAAMQAAAQLLSTSNGTTPIYSGGPSHGVGRSFALTGEYQLLSQLFFGTRFELDRSVDYAPNRFVVYVRYALDHASAQAVNFLPEPFVSPAQY